MRRLARKIRALWRRPQLDRDLEDELRFHLEMKREETGHPQQAHRSFGNEAALKEACRELWTFAALETWWQDIRYAIRTLARTPGFTLIAITALALGIGADTAVFTIANGAFTWNLGLDHVDRIILVGATDPSHHQGFGQSYPEFRDLRSQVKSLAGLAAYQFFPVNVSDKSGLPERYYCAQMSANGFSVIEQRPVLGRDFTAEDERPGAPPVLMLTHHLWQDRYGKDPGIVGKSVRVNETPTTVVGVMPPGKRFPEDTDLWTPLVPDAALEKRDRRNLMLFGRLGDGVKVAAARAELETIATRLATQYPDTNKGLIADVKPIAWLTGAYAGHSMFAALWAAVGFVLLIACADVANMLLARGAGRAREISIRAAIGAGRGRILRQLLVESVVLSIAGGFLGWLVALGGLRWFDRGTSWLPRPPWLHLSLDGTAFTYLAAISIGAGILFGLAPALRLARIDIYSTLKDGGHGALGGGRGLSLSHLLIVLQMTLCIVLLAGAGLMIRSAVNLYGAPVGVNTSDVLTMRINLAAAKYPRREDQLAFHRTLQARLESLPGVETAAVASNLPFSGWTTFAYELEGSPVDLSRPPRIGAIVASPGYFRVMHVNPHRGRRFTEADGVAGAPVVIVNESFAAKFWPGENALGKNLRLIKERSPQQWLTVIGVVPDILQNFRQPLQHDPLMYLPYTEELPREVFIVSRTHVPPGTLAEAFRRTVQSIDENLPVYDMRTLDDRLAESRLSVKLLGGMFSIFASIALLLASVGLYAVMAHAVSQRTQEIGVRMAMGGTRGDILGLVFAQGMRPLALGVAIGLPLAFGVTHALRMGLVGVSPNDPTTYLAVVLILAVTGIVGCAIPARRAIRVDPVVALRNE
jgi:putative ABC transport system permease protein